jgi:hypothetical protein
VAGYFSFSRDFLHGRDECLGPAHRET